VRLAGVEVGQNYACWQAELKVISFNTTIPIAIGPTEMAAEILAILCEKRMPGRDRRRYGGILPRKC